MFNRISQNSMNTPLNLPLLGETISYFFINRTQVQRVRRSLKRLLCELFMKVVMLLGLPIRFRRFKVTFWFTGKRVRLLQV